jgi:hypothetical protein
MMKFRNACAALMVVGLTAGCNGWPKAIEYSEAEHKPEKYVTYAPAADDQLVTVEFQGRRWMVQPAVMDMPGVKLQSVGTAGSSALFAPEGAAAPYDVVFAQAEGGKWRRVEPIE